MTMGINIQKKDDQEILLNIELMFAIQRWGPLPAKSLPVENQKIPV